MAKRLAICDITGTGTYADPYRPAIDGTGWNYICLLASNPDGTPKRTWCLALLSGTSFTSPPASVDLLPAVPLDTLISSLSAAVQNAINTRLAARGIDPGNFVTVRDLVRALGRLHVYGFDENTIDVT